VTIITVVRSQYPNNGTLLDDHYEKNDGEAKQAQAATRFPVVVFEERRSKRGHHGVMVVIVGKHSTAGISLTSARQSYLCGEYCWTSLCMESMFHVKVLQQTGWSVFEAGGARY